MIQIENEYGEVGKDKGYIEGIRKIWWELGVQTEQYIIDAVYNLARTHWTGSNLGIGIIHGTSEEQFTFAKTIEPSKMIFGIVRTGKPIHWG